jgi:pilus assembly protein CpaF
MTVTFDPRLLVLLREAMLDESGCDAAGAARTVVEREASILSSELRERLISRLVADAAGLGPIERLLADPAVDEVMINGPDEIWVERCGVLERTEAGFGSRESLRDAIDRMLAPSGRRVDQLMPLTDARLPDGSRINVALPPLAVSGPIVTIRRFRSGGRTLDDLLRLGTLEPDCARLLEEAVLSRRNILIAGATGSGKTTTLAALAAAIPVTERLVTVEDAAELSIEHPHVIRLEARPTSTTGQGAIAIRDLVRNSLRMRPDRIVVGEVRGEEAIDMLDAMTTGHAGSLSTVHAGSPQGALDRLTALAHSGARGLSADLISERVASVLDLVVHQVRREDGSRVVDSICSVAFDHRATAVDLYRRSQSSGFETDDPDPVKVDEAWDLD